MSKALMEELSLIYSLQGGPSLSTAVRDEGWAELLRAAAARDYRLGTAATKTPGSGLEPCCYSTGA